MQDKQQTWEKRTDAPPQEFKRQYLLSIFIIFYFAVIAPVAFIK